MQLKYLSFAVTNTIVMLKVKENNLYFIVFNAFGKLCKILQKMRKEVDDDMAVFKD